MKLKKALFSSALFCSMFLVMAFFNIKVNAESKIMSPTVEDYKWYTESSSNTEYIISTPEEFVAFRTVVSAKPTASANLIGIQDSFEGKTVIIANDLDFSNYETSTGALYTFPGIGSKTSPFKGVLDGNGKHIKNISINKSLTTQNTTPYGLFNYTLGSNNSSVIIKNLYLDIIVEVSCTADNVKQTSQGAASYGIGGLVGYGEYLSIENCNVSGNIYNFSWHTGGVVGCLKNGTISNTTFTGNVENTGITETSNAGTYTGGICGYAYGDVEIENCVSDSNIIGNRATGGIVGQIAITTGKKVNKCFVTKQSTIKDNSSYGYVGGIAGFSSADITNSCSLAKIEASNSNVGAITAGNGTGNEFNVKSCIADGQVLIDGVITNFFDNNESNAKYTNVVYNMDSVSSDKVITGVTGCSTAQFKDRTVVDLLNGDSESPVWFQNTDYPDFATNMTLVSDITVPATFVVDAGKTAKLLATVTPEDATNKALVYTSKDETIATIADDGTITAVKAGETEITVTALDSGMLKTVKVTVKEEEKKQEEGTTETKPVVQNGSKETVGKSTFTVTSTKDKTVAYTAPTSKKLTSVTVPATVKIGNVSYKVTSIANNAFSKNKKLKSVVIGKNVKTVGKNAFLGCSSLKKVTFKTSVLKKVGSKAFKGIHKKAVIKVPAKKLKAYKKILKGKGQAKTVKIKK